MELNQEHQFKDQNIQQKEGMIENNDKSHQKHQKDKKKKSQHQNKRKRSQSSQSNYSSSSDGDLKKLPKQDLNMLKKAVIQEEIKRKREAKAKLKLDEEDKQNSPKSSEQQILQPDKDDDGFSYYELNNKKRVTIKKYKAATLVDIRETYEKDGQTMYSKSGISLTIDVWKKLKALVSSIDKEIEKLK